MIVKPPSTKRLLGFAGGVVTLICVGFFLKALFHAMAGLQPGTIGPGALAVTALLCPCYACMLLLLANSWQSLLYTVERRQEPLSSLIAVYALTQFAKYLPGNVFHLAGRHAILTRRGFRQSALLASTLYENLMLVLAAVACGTVLTLLFPSQSVIEWFIEHGVPRIVFSFTIRATVCLGLSAAVILIAGAAFKRLAGVRVYRALSLDGLFFVLQGLAFLLVVYGVCGRVPLQALGALSISWIAGFVTPGAPGGVGVREMVLLLLLGYAVGHEDLVLAASLYRIVTFGGDLLFFCYGALRIGLRGKHATASATEDRGDDHELVTQADT